MMTGREAPGPVYATPEELIDLFGQREMALLSTHGDSGEPDREALCRAIECAQSEVDSYLATRYAVPLAQPVPQAVMMVVGDIVRYRLTSGDITEKEPITERYRLAIAWLKDVAKGLVALPCQGVEDAAGNVALDCGQRVWG